MRTKIFFIVILGLLCFSCVKDRLVSPDSPSDGKGVKLYITMPERTEVVTRATEPENQIDPNSIYVLISSTHPTSPVLLDFAMAIKENEGVYRVGLNEQYSPVRIDVVVNAKSVLDDQSIHWERGETLMSIVKASLQTPALPIVDGVVTANPTLHPMVGGCLVNTIDSNTSIGTSSVPVVLTPATVKVVVENRVAVGSGYTFDMQGANLGAAPEKGFVMDGGNSAQFPVRNYGATGDVSSMLSSVHMVNSVQTTMPLFCYESVAANDTFVIIKATYNNQLGYYKLGFYTDAVKQSSRPLLRGFYYKMAIRAVLINGYASAEEAISSPASNGVLYDINVEDGDSYDIISNGVQYLGVSNSEYVGYHTNYINEYEMYYTDGVNNAPSNGFPLTPFLATVLTYTTDPSWNEGTVTASLGITLVDETLTKVTSLPLSVATTTTQAIRKELRILMDNEFKHGQLDIRIGNLHKVIKVKRESSFTIFGGAVSLGSGIAFMKAKTLKDPMSIKGAKCDPTTYGVSYSNNGALLQTGDGAMATDPTQELFLQVKNRFEWELTNYCYGELYLHHNTSDGRTKVSFSVEMLGGEPWGDYTLRPQYAVSQAFWKHNEKGERLIQLTQNQYSVPSSPTMSEFPYVGRWQVRILSGEDFITLDEWDELLTVTNNRFDGDPENRLVTGSKTLLYGKEALIQFRLGLKSTNVGSANRYGLVQVIYIDHRGTTSELDPRKVSCLIFVRQGETPDHILTPGTMYPRVGNPSQMVAAPDVKFSPYHLIDPTLGAGGSEVLDHTAITNDVKPIMAPYPSYAPYLFQWSGERMFHSFNDMGPLTGWHGWDDNLPETSYNPPAFKEHCPAGYITPPFKINGVEVGFGLRASFGANYFGNAVTGTCADGHLDRYIHADYKSNFFSNYAPHTNLRLETTDGAVIFNPQTLSSIYIQECYYRNPLAFDGGAITGDREVGYDYMWSSDIGTKPGFAYAISNRGRSSAAFPGTEFRKAGGLQIRCIKDPAQP